MSAATYAQKEELEEIAHALDAACKLIHIFNAKWWVDIHTGMPIERNIGEALMLIVTEVAEAMEGHRKGLRDDKLPHHSMLTVELADALIRIFDLAGGLKLPLATAFYEKTIYNLSRIDHTLEARRAEGGKKI